MLKVILRLSTTLLVISSLEVSGYDYNTLDNNILDEYTQNDPLDLARTRYVNVSKHPGALCNRECREYEKRICYFKFVLEHYQAMGVACGECAKGVIEDCKRPQCIVGDGVEKGVMSINRMIPGPAIQVCKGDMVIVDVVNNAHGTAAAMHWHGIHMRDTPFMDGVPYTTQCPIPFASTFRYYFGATEAGTQFYHSHSGHHKVNGQYGALIVRQPESQVLNSIEYDFDMPEHYILISDWMHDYGEQYFPGLPSSQGIFPDSLLINGRGTYINPKTRKHTQVPVIKYFVEPGKRYRFRVINAVSHACPVQLQVEAHSLTVISSDSYDVEPRPFDTLVTNAGERYDFVLAANHTQGDFWIRVRGLEICATNPTESFALIRYKTNNVDPEASQPAYPAYEKSYPLGVILNNPNATCFENEYDHCVSELTSLEEDPELLTKNPDEKFFLAFHNYPVPNEEIFRPGTYNHFANLQSNLTIVGAVNNLSMVFPSSPPLTQPCDVDESQFCNEWQWPDHCVGNRLCPCIHRIQIKKDSIVELVIIDESEAVGRMHHPFHLHGYRFMVTGLGQYPHAKRMTVSLAKQIELGRRLPRNLNDRPPFKDTVSIPSCGYAIVRFRADNPGYWLMHCHYEWHLAIGMGLMVQVGTPSQMVSAPKGFPQCNNYVPKIIEY